MPKMSKRKREKKPLYVFRTPQNESQHSLNNAKVQGLVKSLKLPRDRLVKRTRSRLCVTDEHANVFEFAFTPIAAKLPQRAQRRKSRALLASLFRNKGKFAKVSRLKATGLVLLAVVPAEPITVFLARPSWSRFR